jgi:hypothetical protein
MTDDNNTLRELYDRYRAFVTKMDDASAPKEGKREGWDYPVMDYPEFCEWWDQLDPKVRMECEQDFSKGFDTVLAETKKEIQIAIDARLRQDGEERPPTRTLG